MQVSTSRALPQAFSSLALIMTLGLASCASPPQLPSVDESRKHPANAAVAVELQVCKSELQNTHIQADESAQAVSAEKAAIERFLEQQTSAASPETQANAANTVYSVHFAFNSTQVAIPEADAAHLIDEARGAPLILLRGRTDGAIESHGESRIARERAAAVRAFLVRAGVPATHIRATWQPIGDPAADNASTGGRSLNRRVEIEIYRNAPRAMTPGSAPTT